MKQKSSFRMWKSGKVWLYGTIALSTLVITSQARADVVDNKDSVSEPSIQMSSQTDTNQSVSQAGNKISALIDSNSESGTASSSPEVTNIESKADNLSETKSNPDVSISDVTNKPLDNVKSNKEETVTDGSVSVSDSNQTATLLVDDGNTQNSLSSNEDNSSAASAGATDKVAIYRLYNPINGEHLYTSFESEKSSLYNQGWGYEGISWYSPSKGTAVYRLYNKKLRNHLYTTDKNEVTVLTKKYGWSKDNNGKALFYSGGNTGIYRLYNKALSGMHLLTTSNNEYSSLPSYGWKGEGMKLYGLSKGETLSKTKYKSANLLSTPYYNQRDSRWGGYLYGSWTLGDSGCVPTSLAMVFSSLQEKTILPTAVANYLYKDTLNFNRSGQGTSQAGIAKAVKHWKLNYKVLNSQSAIINSLKAGNHVLAAVENDRFVLHGSHELVLKGYRNGQVYVYDPYTSGFSGWYALSYIYGSQSRYAEDRQLGQPFVEISD